MTTPRSWKKSLEYASRSRSFLWRISIAVILAGVAIGWALHHFRPSLPLKLAERILAAVPAEISANDTSGSDSANAFITAFEEEIGAPSISFAHVVQAIPKLAMRLASDEKRTAEILRRRFPADQAELAVAFLALFTADPSQHATALQHLQNMASAIPPQPFANEMLGRFALKEQRYEAAYFSFRKEGEREEAVEARTLAIHALIAAKNFAELERVSQEERYAPLITAHDRLEAAIASGDWKEIAKRVALSQLATQQRGILVLACITGLAWAFFLLHLAETKTFFSSTTLLCFAGFLLGVLSTTPTICLVIWQDDMLQFAAGDNAFQILAYQIGGVGLREELCKLLLFTPLIPFLLKKDDERVVLIVASFVGLGFAIEENGNYFLATEGAAVPGRFLTANFLHTALTGMNGLALFRAFTRGAPGLNQFLTVLPLTILVHGLYNALPEIHELMDLGGYLSITLYVVFSILYFNRANELRENVRMTISLTGAFVLGLSLVAAASIVDQITTLGLASGLTIIVPELIGVGVLILMFLRVFDEALSD
jgi:protease PrsW